MPAARVRFGTQITITDLLLRAVALALPGEQPADVALAVATPRGVLNPVIPDVRAHDLPALAELRAAAVQRARDGRLNAADVAPAATTLSNLGTAGVDHFTGIVTPGQTTLLTLGTIAPRVVADGGDGRRAPDPARDAQRRPPRARRRRRRSAARRLRRGARGRHGPHGGGGMIDVSEARASRSPSRSTGSTGRTSSNGSARCS